MFGGYSGRVLPKTIKVKFDCTELGMLDKLSRVTGFSNEELVRKAVRKYFCCVTNSFYGKIMDETLKDIASDEAEVVKRA